MRNEDSKSLIDTLEGELDDARRAKRIRLTR
jgi:hypothetical protein